MKACGNRLLGLGCEGVQEAEQRVVICTGDQSSAIVPAAPLECVGGLAVQECRPRLLVLGRLRPPAPAVRSHRRQWKREEGTRQWSRSLPGACPAASSTVGKIIVLL